jgi:hypothetical protein
VAPGFNSAGSPSYFRRQAPPCKKNADNQFIISPGILVIASNGIQIGAWLDRINLFIDKLQKNYDFVKS